MKNKKVTFGKSLDNLTEKQFHFLQNVKGGFKTIGKPIIYPTIAAPGCAEGYKWLDDYGCVPNNFIPIVVGVKIK